MGDKVPGASAPGETVASARDAPPSLELAGPRTFEVTGVVVGDGPELTVANATGTNPSNYCGDVEVDIDPVAQTITVAGGEEIDCWFEVVTVTITTAEIASVAVVSDGLTLLVDEETPGPAAVVQTAADGVTLTWTWDGTTRFYPSGSSVFSYERVAPAEPADPVVADPAFTG